MIKQDAYLYDPEKELTQDDIDDAMEQYKEVQTSSYSINNGVILLVEPAEGIYRTYISAFPSEQKFLELKQRNNELQRFSTVGDYQRFVLDTLESEDNKHPSYKRFDLYIPLSQQGWNGAGFQTSMSLIIDKMINNQ